MGLIVLALPFTASDGVGAAFILAARSIALLFWRGAMTGACRLEGRGFLGFSGVGGAGEGAVSFAPFVLDVERSADDELD